MRNTGSRCSGTSAGREAADRAADEQGREIHLWNVCDSGGRDTVLSSAGDRGIPHCRGGKGLPVYRQQEYRRVLRDAEGLLLPSKLGKILEETPALRDYTAKSGEWIPYKGRFYCWTEISKNGQIRLTEAMLSFLHLEPAMPLLSIRSSDIAFTMGAKGPLLEKAANYEGMIPRY